MASSGLQWASRTASPRSTGRDSHPREHDGQQNAELPKQAAVLKKKEATAERVGKARSAAEDLVKQLMKRLQDLEAAAMHKLLFLPRSFPLLWPWLDGMFLL